MDYKAGSTGAEWRTPPRVCRCCLSEGCYKDISSEYYWMGVKEIYAEMLKECFDLTLTVQETGSNARLICEVCITRLRDASNFKKQVVSSDKRFTEHIKSGASLSTACSRDLSNFTEIKIESIKDEEAVISDDDPPDPDDVDFDDDGYDESDSLPLKFEAQKKESMAELSFGDEMPVLSNTETTIKKVSKVKDNKVLKKLKLNKKELTIKPVKASSSKAKAPKEPRVKLKPAKTAKKGSEEGTKENEIIVVGGEEKLTRAVLDRDSVEKTDRVKNGYQKSAKTLARQATKSNVAIALQYSTLTPFRWCRNCFVCSYCDKKFMNPEDIRAHNRLQHSNQTLQLIQKTIKTPELINVDLTDSACRLCDEPISDLEEFHLHLVLEHKKRTLRGAGGLLPFSLCKDTWDCIHCKMSFNNFLKLYEHMNVHYQSYICDSCGKGFMTAQRLRKHKDSHTVGAFLCNICEEQFNTRAAREHHKIRIHQGGPRYECPHCSVRFINYYERLRHMSSEHNVKETKYKCLHCDMTFQTSGKRSVHVRTTHLPPTKKFSCDRCPWEFTTQYELKRHMVRHTGERTFHCSYCAKSYPRAKTLREHMRAHCNDKRFSCAVCGQAFVQKVSWRKHLSAHHPDCAEQLARGLSAKS